ncbi:MAG: carboxyl transferase domain-containing protein [Deinococcales bacterium]
MPLAPKPLWAQARQESQDPKLNTNDLYGLFPTQGGTQPFDMHEFIGRLVDDSLFDEYKAGYGQTILCGTARLGGYSVGISFQSKKCYQEQEQNRGGWGYLC